MEPALKSSERNPIGPRREGPGSGSPGAGFPDSGNEREIVESARSGHREAFDLLHSRYAPMVHAILLSRVPAGEAEDLVQDVFLKAFRQIHTLRAVESIGAWLGTIARNRAIDYHRQSVRVAPLPSADNLPASTPPPALEAEEALSAVRNLPETYREILLMRLVEGMTGPEISQATGLTAGSVRVKLHRGMKLLREQLKGPSHEQ